MPRRGSKSLKRRRDLSVPRDRTLDDMKRFYRSLDLAGLWEDFYATSGADGRPKYKTSKQMARAVGVNDMQREFLTWLLGPADGDTELALQYSWVKPLEFDKRRETGGWYTEENVRNHSQAIRREINALEALRSAGNGITINSLARMETLARKLDEDFGGRFFSTGLSFEDNLKRARAYVELHSRIITLIDRAQDMYAKSHGINFADMSGFERLLAAQALVTVAQKGGHESKAGQVLDKIVQMTLEKHAEHRIPLPAAVENVVVMDGKVAKKDKNVM